MLKRIEKYWPFISLLLLAVILAFQFFRPADIRPLSLIVMGVGLGAVIAFTTQRHVQAHREGKTTRQALVRDILVDVLGALLTMALVILAGGRAGVYAGQVIGREAEAIRAGWGIPAGILAGVLAGLMVGFCVGWLVQKIWERMKKAKALAAP
jgi:membrane-bound metal-dependent hydrolase YbcI (DUF457 family)